MSLGRERERAWAALQRAKDWAVDEASSTMRLVGPGRYISGRNDRYGVFDTVASCGSCGTIGTQVTDFDAEGSGDVGKRKRKIAWEVGRFVGPRFRAIIAAYTRGRGWHWVIYELTGEPLSWVRLGVLTQDGRVESIEAPELGTLLASVLAH